MDRKELDTVLENHRKWFNDEAGGERAVLRRVDLRDVDLWDVDLQRVVLRDVDLRGAVLRRVDLRDVDLRRVDLRGVVLQRVDLRGAVLRDIDLRGVVLRDVDLRRVDLRRVDVWGAVLQRVDLRDVDLRGVDLRGVDLRGVKNLPDSVKNLVARDLLFIFEHLRAELPFLRERLIDGKVDGNQYEGECACLIGTFAKQKGNGDGVENVCAVIPFYEKGLHNPGEMWFYNIREGDTPENSEFSAFALELVDRVLNERGGV